MKKAYTGSFKDKMIIKHLQGSPFFEEFAHDLNYVNRTIYKKIYLDIDSRIENIVVWNIFDACSIVGQYD